MHESAWLPSGCASIAAVITENFIHSGSCITSSLQHVKEFNAQDKQCVHTALSRWPARCAEDVSVHQLKHSVMPLSETEKWVNLRCFVIITTCAYQQNKVMYYQPINSQDETNTDKHRREMSLLLFPSLQNLPVLKQQQRLNVKRCESHFDRKCFVVSGSNSIMTYHSSVAKRWFLREENTIFRWQPSCC